MSQLHKEFYFPTQIYFRDIDGAEELNQALRRDIYAWRESDPAGIERSNMAALESWHSAIDMHHRPEFAALVAHILDAAQEIFADLRYAQQFEPVCDTMWANINPRYGQNRHHTHPGVLWSGVYYVQAPPECGRIHFMDPRAQAHVLVPRFDTDVPRKPENWSEVHFEPIEGRLVLFPAWLGHDVRPNLTTETGAAGDRISVSFNLYQQVRSGSTFHPPEGHDSRGEVSRDQLSAGTAPDGATDAGPASD